MYQNWKNTTVLLSQNPNTAHLIYKDVIEKLCSDLRSYTDGTPTCDLLPRDNLVRLCHDPNISGTRKLF